MFDRYSNFTAKVYFALYSVIIVYYLANFNTNFY